MLIAAVAAWAILNFLPFRFEIPEELMSVNMYSPPELQAELAAEESKAYWKNTLLVFGLIGLCFGAVPLLVSLGRESRGGRTSVIAGLFAGIACGLLAAVLGIIVWRYLASGGLLSAFDQGTAALVADMIVFALVSVLLLVPTTLAVRPARGQSQKIVALPLAGLLTGLVLPPVVSFFFPAAQTNLFPPEGLLVTGLWLAMLAVLAFLFSSMTGSRQVKSADVASTAEGAA